MLTDKFGRKISYLRVSLTDRCNLRCTYCMPRAYKWMEKEHILTLEEIERLIKIASELGITKIRLTGGEPLLRQGLADLVKKLSKLPLKIHLTTNGMLLSRYAEDLHRAGLEGINISLDSLRPEKFSAITGGGSLEEVLYGIEKAKEAGFTPVKVNVVVLRNINSDEIENFLWFSKKTGVVIRFIECMPFSTHGSHGRLFSRADILQALKPYLSGDLFPSPRQGEPAAYYPLVWGGEVGIISPITCRFCSLCNRLRLTADGFLKPCLGANIEVNIKEQLRQGADDQILKELFHKAIMLKPEEGRYDEKRSPDARPMVCVGG